MKKIRILSLVAAMLAAGSVTAATVNITIDSGSAITYTLGSLSVDSSGNATVSAASSGNQLPSEYTVTINQSTGGTISGTSGPTAAGTTGTWNATADTANGYAFSSWGGICAGTSGTSCSKPVNGNSAVSAIFALAGGGGEPIVSGNCPPVDPTKVTVIDTNVSGGYYGRIDFNSVAPSQIYAYKFTTKSAASLGNWVAAKLSVATTGKLVKITQCAGVLEATNTVGLCERSTSESTRIDYAVNRPDLSTRSTCHLQPDTVYYAHVVSKFKLTDTVNNCTTTKNCGFSMTGE